MKASAIECPQCGGRWRVYCTSKKEDSVIQYRKCKDCGYKGRTENSYGEVTEISRRCLTGKAHPVKADHPWREPWNESKKAALPFSRKARHKLADLKDAKELFPDDPLFR